MKLDPNSDELRGEMEERGVKVRASVSSDIDECVALYRQMVNYHREIYEDSNIPYNDEGIRKKLQRSDPNYIKIVAEKDEKIVGLLTINISGRTCEIDEILVEKDVRGLGIGTTMAERIMRIAKERGCAEIKVSFAARNVRALTFYYDEIGLNCLGMIEIFAPLTERGREQWYTRGKRTTFLGLDFYY